MLHWWTERPRAACGRSVSPRFNEWHRKPRALELLGGATGCRACLAALTQAPDDATT
ncbi:MAG: hypothetical protein ACRDQ2_03435 [Gaiellales bacterium]